MYYLLMEKFNNYLNRFMKKFDTVQEYKDYCTANSYNFVHYTTKSVNFNKRDNITSSHVFNDNLKPNYLLWINETTGAIVSRWFVTRYTHTSGNQFNAELKRDVLGDNYEAVLESPAFIEKGFIDNQDPAVFNKEDFVVNQIKKGEQQITDMDKCSWIIGYCESGSAVNGTITDYNTAYEYEVGTTFASWTYASLCNAGALKNIDKNSENTRVYFNMATRYQAYSWYGPYFYVNANTHYAYSGEKILNDCWILNDVQKVQAFKNEEWWNNLSWSTIISNIYTDNPSFVNDSAYNTLMSLNGKKVKFSDGIYAFNVVSTKSQETRKWATNTSATYNYMYTQVSATLTNVGASIATAHNTPVYYDLTMNNFSVTAIKDETAQGAYTYSMKSTHKNLQDAPYRMFAIPYPSVSNVTEVQVNGIEINSELSLNWAIQLAADLGSKLYDIQILPYFPGDSSVTQAFDYITRTYKTYTIYNNTGSDTVDFMYLKDSNSVNKNICFFFEKSTFLKNPLNISYFSEDDFIYYGKYKESNELTLYRLCSPNYSSCFEFSPAKNGGNYRHYIVYCTYKPYQPFIYVAPLFSELYGKDYKDNRGLILSGDFSLPIISSAWTQYQLNNKNYLLAFDRQIESLELNQSWAYKQSVANAITGTIKGGAMGGTTGAMAGGPWGAVAGAIIGTATSGVGGALDLKMQRELNRDAKELAIDNFRMNLQNIQAIPNTLNKVSSLVATSKIFPFVEFYCCTDKEIEAFENKIKYNGMTINRIGYIKDFLNPGDTTFVKAKLIRNESIACSSDELLEISNELNKGVYI